jgi:hypothetical protein
MGRSVGGVVDPARWLPLGASAPGRARRAASPVALPAGQDHKKLSIQAVHQGLAFISAARPAHGQAAPGARALPTLIP